MTDQVVLDKWADKYFGAVLPIAAGLADSTDEVMHLKTDQYLLLQKLSQKVIEMKSEAIAAKIGKLFADPDSGQPQSNAEMIRQVMSGKE